jgi:phospholipase C
MHKISRRGFLGTLAAASLANAANAVPVSSFVLDDEKHALPSPQNSGIEHVVLVSMENRSFDHILGWLPHANGKQAGLTYLDKSGQPHPTYHLTDYQNCALADPDHSYAGGRIQFDGGKCDGWLRASTNDLFPIGYYEAKDVSFLSQAAPYWTACDHYFAAILAPTYPNRFYMHSAQTDRLDQSLTLSTLPTIWDRLASAGIDGRYFYNDVPFTAFWGAKYLGITHPYLEFIAACETGMLPQVSYIDPRFIDEASGTSNDDHPHADIRNGEAFLNQVYTAVTNSPAWQNTVLIITFDEWGGFFDHVAPPVGPIPPTDAALGSDGRLGFRVPALIISPFARRQYIARRQFDHTSVLKLIEWRWSLSPLTVRDAAANNVAAILDFDQPDLGAPPFSVPIGPFGGACASGLTSAVPSSNGEQNEWSAVESLAKQYGFQIPQ